MALVVEGHALHRPTVEASGRRRLALAGHAGGETFPVLTLGASFATHGRRTLCTHPCSGSTSSSRPDR